MSLVICFVNNNLKPVKKDILEETVPGFVHLTVNRIHVYTQMDGVLPVLQVGWVIIVPLVMLS